VNVVRSDKNPEAVTEGSIVTDIDDQPKVEECAVKEAVIFDIAESNPNVKIKSDEEVGTDDNVVRIKHLN